MTPLKQDDPFMVMDPDPIRRVEIAMADLRAGKLVIMVDDEDRENEGDLVGAGEMTTPEQINFMAVHARGLICLTLTAEQVDRLGLPMMASHNQSMYNTAFTVSIEARHGVTTGISAADRAHTVQVAIRPDASPRDLVTPGHVFPLRARDGGVLERVGQTEGSVDLSRMAGLNPSAVICEIMRDDGTMARLPDLLEFGVQHKLHLVAVADLIKYRMRNERIVKPVRDGTIEIPGYGAFRARLYQSVGAEGHHLAVWKGDLDSDPTLVRVQAAPPAWAFLAPNASALSGSAASALARISDAGAGALVLMHLRGMSVEFVERAFERDVHGAVAPMAIPSADVLRDLGAGCQILRDLGLSKLRIMISGGRHILGVEAYGLSIVERVSL